MRTPILQLVQLSGILRVRFVSLLKHDLEHVDNALDDVHLAGCIHDSTLDSSWHFVLVYDSGSVRRE